MQTRNFKLLLISLFNAGFIVACNNGSSSSSSSQQANSCQANVNNFSNVSQTSLIGSQTGNSWGPNLTSSLSLPESLNVCESVPSWSQQRVIAAADYWVTQQVNYCHHHVPTWFPEPIPANLASFEACESAPNVMAGTPTFGQISRWNYSNIGNQTPYSWYRAGSYFPIGNYSAGLDCSDYTKLVYAYGLGTYFTSDVSMQAGQSDTQSQLAPNLNGFIDSPESDLLGLYSAGRLLCANGTLAPPRGIANANSCDESGGYMSVFAESSDGVNVKYNPNAITDQMLALLKPGDLIYIAGSAYDADPNSINYGKSNPQVTHVVIWTGLQVGSSAIPNNLLAPQLDQDSWGIFNNQCSSNPVPFWSPENPVNNNAWIITDSHYQGPDYRIFTNCFYRNQVWGIRRVIGVSN